MNGDDAVIRTVGRDRRVSLGVADRRCPLTLAIYRLMMMIREMLGVGSGVAWECTIWAVLAAQ